MKKALFAALSAIMVLSLCACGGNNEPQPTERPRVTQAPIAGGNYDFAIKNDLGSSISELYISESSSNDWGDNLLSDESVYDGGAYEVSFSPEMATVNAEYDIAVITGDDAEYHFEGINLNDIDVITLTWNGDDDVIAELD